MKLPTTEDRDPQSIGLSKRTDEEILSLLLDRQIEALNATALAIPQISRAAKALQEAAEAEQNIGYAGAGSAGLTALADCLELPGTFGFPPERMCILFAGGAKNLLHMAGSFEDSEQSGVHDFEASGLGANDILIGVSASGTTPYTLGTFRAAALAGTRTIGIANNQESPLLTLADYPIFLKTPPEMIAGSTRLGAASAQKVALNMISTLVALRLGHAVRGHMVNMVADNDKLRQRAQRILQDLTDCTSAAAEEALRESGGRVKIAIVMLREGLNVRAAEEALDLHGGNLRPLL
ncbi:MAG: N-acetylmuramic acid 6-phosphate etherase [Roseibium sp.]|uniref:N-acetylmuramic acid 6-phosphate etherase n=1 Tax=Roseibium sp. TaxID=1936156 RepID=UPI001B0BEBFB|nr:N-acetylmuramic acid 6-phosphate etherase [Roseibium sp.]MBO6891495.1 N-acetylmuramic acid 6-phosphate etherase [Roseibium sp.]MBO6929035.1 N-acetylmuramic acid 6-phosphate etherase [Roseibium sp.]